MIMVIPLSERWVWSPNSFIAHEICVNMHSYDYPTSISLLIQFFLIQKNWCRKTWTHTFYSSTSPINPLDLFLKIVCIHHLLYSRTIYLDFYRKHKQYLDFCTSIFQDFSAYIICCTLESSTLIFTERHKQCPTYDIYLLMKQNCVWLLFFTSIFKHVIYL